MVIHACNENRETLNTDRQKTLEETGSGKMAAPPAGASEGSGNFCKAKVKLVRSSSAFIKVAGQCVNAPLLRFQYAAK